VTANSGSCASQARRRRSLAGTLVPPLALQASTGRFRNPAGALPRTVSFRCPGAYVASTASPAAWSEVPGAEGCTAEAATFRDRIGEFALRDAEVVGVSTQRPEEPGVFAAWARIPYPLLSGQDLQLAAALRLPAFRAAGRDNLKRLILIVGRSRQIRHVLFPVPDPVASVERGLAMLGHAEA